MIFLLCSQKLSVQLPCTSASHHAPHVLFVQALPSLLDRELPQERNISLNFSHAARGLAHSCLSGMGKCIQVSTDLGNTACSDAGDYLYLAYNPNFRNCFSMFTCIDALQIAQASVWLFLNSANHEGSLHIYFKKIHS